MAAGIEGVSLLYAVIFSAPITRTIQAGSARIESGTLASAERTPAHAFRA